MFTFIAMFLQNIAIFIYTKKPALNFKHRFFIKFLSLLIHMGGRVLTGDRKDCPLGDIGRMIADTLEIFGDHQ